MFYIILFAIVLLFVSRIVLDQIENNTFQDDFTNQPVIFLDSNKFIDFIQKDQDGYIQSLSTFDLIARKVGSAKEYIEKICKDTKNNNEPISFSLKKKIELCCKRADGFFTKTAIVSKFYNKNIEDIPWNIAVFKTQFYEEGIPHTRMKTIFLQQNYIEKLSKTQLTSLLIHEKVHIFQRYHQDPDIIYDLGFRRISKKNADMFVRSNPDLDDYVYIDILDYKTMVKKYTSIYPKSINDVIEPLKNNMIHKYEHPYEYIAYQVEKEYETDHLRRSKKED